MQPTLIIYRMSATSVHQMRKVPHETLYLENGDIALSLQDKDDDGPVIRIYRVDKPFLSRHSPVFDGLFNIPSNPCENEVYDGALVVPLTGDDPSAFESVLQFLYDPT